MENSPTSTQWRRPNDVSVLILTSLASGAKHGYALASDIWDFAEVRLSPGTLYGAITRLEQSGLIAAQPELNRRRPYEITVAGRRILAEMVQDMSRLAAVGHERLTLGALA